MTSGHSGDMIEADAFSVEELREAVFEGRGRVARPLALALLERKDYPTKAGDLQKILVDEHEQPRLRAMAATGLGRMATPASVRALEKGLETGETVTLRAVATALGGAGGRKHEEALARLADKPDPVGREAGRALGILRRRLGRAAPPAARGVKTMAVQATGKPTAIRVSAATAGDAAKATKVLAGRKLARAGAVSLTCQGRQLVFAFDEASLRRGLDTLARAGEIGVVAEPPGVEASTWSARYHVAVEPQEGTAFRVVVTTTRGHPVLIGRGVRHEREATFELAAADVPGAIPVELRGRFDGKRLTFEQARAGVRRRPSPTPAAER